MTLQAPLNLNYKLENFMPVSSKMSSVSVEALDPHLSVDTIVVGTGPGGATVAKTLARGRAIGSDARMG